MMSRYSYMRLGLPPPRRDPKKFCLKRWLSFLLIATLLVLISSFIYVNQVGFTEDLSQPPSITMRVPCRRINNCQDCLKSKCIWINSPYFPCRSHGSDYDFYSPVKNCTIGLNDLILKSNFTEEDQRNYSMFQIILFIFGVIYSALKYMLRVRRGNPEIRCRPLIRILSKRNYEAVEMMPLLPFDSDATEDEEEE